MDSKKSNKIADIVKLQRILKKWRRNTDSAKNSKIAASSGGSISSSSSKGISFLRRTLSFNKDITQSRGTSDCVPKGYISVCVGEELKRFHIPMDYLSHQAFRLLLQEAEEEFGFHQEGVLRIPCDVYVFESILKVIENKQNVFYTQEYMFEEDESFGYYSSENQHSQRHHHPHSPLCR